MAVYFILTYCAVWSIILSETACWGLQSRNGSKQIKEKPSNVKHADTINRSHFDHSPKEQINFNKNITELKPLMKRQKRHGETLFPLPPRLVLLAVVYLKQVFHQINISAYHSVTLSCDNVISRAIYDEFPMAILFWEFNDQPFNIDPSSMLYKSISNELVLISAQPKNSGVYTCQMTQNFQWVQVVDVFVLQVYSEEVKTYYKEKTKLRLSCHGEALMEIFPGVKRIWYRNNTAVYINDNVQSDVVDIPSEKLHDYDQWQCCIVQGHRHWITANYTLLLMPSIPFTMSTVSLVALLLSSAILVAFITLTVCFSVRKRKKTEIKD
ncbi:uncharacterized protein LOC106882169 isoform X1 [Octopus bimaculoides]|uniref:Ig-like domain-containing protein n=1 Tax=Octopus bimaculoides TaxID=37653 RepID=A0A0L8I8X7_OCTBM|nr:uncharacterized protein LOC106882169 isoform X1 [Octopus bimaculoides]